MNFEFHHTPEQEKFRKEVRAWLDLHMPMDFEMPCNPHDVLPGSIQYEFVRTVRRKLGEKGWLTPTWPKEYGGGGLSVGEAVIIEEEVIKRPWSRFSLGDFFASSITYSDGTLLSVPQLLALGTEEQKKRFLPPILKGEIIVLEGYSEPGCGSDTAAVKTTAIRDGDDYIINGSKIWMGTQFDNADYIRVLALTDPKGPRHHNVGLFMVSMDLPGVSKVRVPMMRNVHTGAWHIFFDNVRVSVENLIGGHENATNAWRVVSTALRPPQVNLRNALPDRSQEFVLAYCKETKRNGQPLSQDPEVREALVEAEIQLEIQRLFAMRQNWMVLAGRRLVGYEAAQSGLHNKDTAREQADAYSDILGPAAMIKDPEWHLSGGRIEYQQFLPVSGASAGTTREINKMLMARSACRVGD